MNTRSRLSSLMVGTLAALVLASCALGISDTPSTPIPNTPAPRTMTAATVPAMATATAATTATVAPAATVGTTATAAAGMVAAVTATVGSTATANTNTARATAAVTMPTTQPPPVAGGQMLTVREVNRRARPAVVQITNNQQQRATSGNNPLGPRGTASVGYEVPAGTGTGFIFDPRGYIITNNHVVDGAASLTVTTTDNKSYDAKLIGAYPDGDIAVIQITCMGDCPTVPVGDSSRLEVGDQVVAIGNALGLEGGPTVTAGVVSALGRTLQEPGEGNQPGPFLIDLIQTDAAINPGNSGGPLFNMQGEVIGINTLGATRAESGAVAQSVGFAISINTAKSTADALIAMQPVPRPFIGISYGLISPSQAAQLRLPVNTGVRVNQVQPGSPADRGGIRTGDVITRLDGQEVRGESGFASILLKRKPGDTIGVTVLRDGQPRDLMVTLVQSMTRR